MNFFQENVYLIGYFWKKSNMHKAKNIYYLLIWKKTEMAQGRVPSHIWNIRKLLNVFFFFFFFFFYYTHV